MAKNIVFCADGTWNSPSQDDDRDETADPTNVYKLFVWQEPICPTRCSLPMSRKKNL
jgi:hypothetical protein